MLLDFAAITSVGSIFSHFIYPMLSTFQLIRITEQWRIVDLRAVIVPAISLSDWVIWTLFIPPFPIIALIVSKVRKLYFFTMQAAV